jgi:hypothetical protein
MIVTDAASEIFTDDPPLFLARTPHGYHDTAQIRKDVEAAGFENIDIVTVEASSAAPSPRHPAIAYCQGTPLRNEIEKRDAKLLQRVVDLATEKIAAGHGQDQVSAKIQGHVVSARA